MADYSPADERKERLETELNAFVHRWSRDPSIRKIILFGSLARGDVASDSDLDLIVIQETEQPFLRRLEPFYEEARVAMDVLVYTPDEFAEMADGVFLKYALADGVVVYERKTGKRRNQMAEISSIPNYSGDDTIDTIYCIPVKAPTLRALHELKDMGQSYDDLISEMIHRERDYHDCMMVAKIERSGEFVPFDPEEIMRDD